MTAVQPWPLSFLNADWLAGTDRISVTGLAKTVIFVYIYSADHCLVGSLAESAAYAIDGT